MTSYRQKEINLYRRYQQNVKRSVNKWLIYFIAVAAILILCFSWDGWLDWRCAKLSKEISETQTYLTDPTNLAEKEIILTIRGQLAKVNAEATKLSKALAAVESYPAINTMLLREIEACSGAAISISISGYQASTGKLDYIAVSTVVIDIPDYIKTLEQSPLFDSVAYSGYNYNPEVGYHVNVSFNLNETAGKAVVQ